MVSKFYVYKLVVGGEPYYGFTSRNPNVRLQEHIRIAVGGKWKHKSKLYPVLSEFEGDYEEFEIVYEGDSELNALLTEIGAIRSAGKRNTLNLSDGGEGSTITVKTREVNGELQVKVVSKNTRKSTSRKRYKRKRYKR